MATHILEDIRQNGVTFGYRSPRWVLKRGHSQHGSSAQLKPVQQWQHDGIRDAITNRTKCVKAPMEHNARDKDMIAICKTWRPAPNAPPPAPTFYERNRLNSWKRR